MYGVIGKPKSKFYIHQSDFTILTSVIKLYVAGKVYQFWVDPAPRDDTRIVIERTDPRRVSSEIIIRRSIILDHLPSNFDLAFRRAREALMLSDTLSNRRSSESEPGILGNTEKEGSLDNEVLKRTTTRHKDA